MNRLETKRIVFARIPDLNASHSGHDMEGEKNTGWGPTGSRLLNQALSFKLLAGGTLLLLAVAILPSVFTKKAPSTDTPATAGASPANRLQSHSESADSVSPWRAATAQTVPKPPTLLRPSPTERSQAPVAVLPPPPEVQGKPTPNVAEDVPTLSVWPNPVHPVSQQSEVGAEKSPANSNPPTAIRPPEYQADVRADPRPIEAGTAPNGVAP